MHIIIRSNGFYFGGKVGELRLFLAKLTDNQMKFASFLQQNLQ